MRFNTIKQLFRGLYYTNYYGYKLGKTTDLMEKNRLRLAYSTRQLDSLNITVKVENEDKIPTDGQYLLIGNHRTVIDPPIIEKAFSKSNIFGVWVSKKELYGSFLFGLFVRNAGSILLDREKSQMSGFFKETKEAVKRGESIFIFPEGTRNKSASLLGTFKEGARIIALKNRIPILPVYIKPNAKIIFENALGDSKLKQEITVVIGDLIDYKNRDNLEMLYRDMFNLKED